MQGKNEIFFEPMYFVFEYDIIENVTAKTHYV